MSKSEIFAVGCSDVPPLLRHTYRCSDSSRVRAILTAARLTAKRDWLMSELAAKDAQLAGLEAVLAEAAVGVVAIPGVAVVEAVVLLQATATSRLPAFLPHTRR